MSNNMDKQSYIDEAEKELLHTYNRFSLVLDHGEGVHLYDTDGNAYLDFAAGIAVCALGYSNEHHKEALKAQVDKLLHTSNLYYNAPVIEAADKVLNASKMDRIFFTNSGTEAIEGAIKAAKKYAFTRDGHAGHEIIAMNHSFHGRSIGALSVTGNAHYQEPFEPLMPGVKSPAIKVRGQVIDEQGEPLTGATVRIKGGQGGTITDVDGNFQLEVAGNAILSIARLRTATSRSL
jgi:acetylornithine/N-succinyldiaminopimelate aminotransferase